MLETGRQAKAVVSIRRHTEMYRSYDFKGKRIFKPSAWITYNYRSGGLLYAWLTESSGKNVRGLVPFRNWILIRL
ncbi:hypothetical protein D3C79_647070 [compost metagenome]